MVDLSALMRDPSAASSLSPDERARLLQQCAALILALSQPVTIEDKPDRMLTAQQCAEKLNLSIGWVRDNVEGWLKPAKVKAGGALRFSENMLDKLIREGRGE